MVSRVWSTPQAQPSSGRVRTPRLTFDPLLSPAGRRTGEKQGVSENGEFGSRGIRFKAISLQNERLMIKTLLPHYLFGCEEMEITYILNDKRKVR